MKISDIKAYLERAAQVAGDIEVGIRAVEGEVDTVLHAVEVIIPTVEGKDPTVNLVHGPAPEAAPAPDQPADPAGAGAPPNPSDG